MQQFVIREQYNDLYVKVNNTNNQYEILRKLKLKSAIKETSNPLYSVVNSETYNVNLFLILCIILSKTLDDAYYFFETIY